LLLVGVVSLAAVTVAFLAYLSETGVGGGTVLERGGQASRKAVDVSGRAERTASLDPPDPTTGFSIREVP